ncbi:MAG: MFS transporter [Candidatus Eutrophobiaceae bacterium]
MAAPLSRLERHAGLALALVFFLRMLGLFLVFPVLALATQGSPIATGLALGIYALTQACFQIPFGVLSDRLGRKPIIIFGLGIFIIGSLLAAHASDVNSMALLILARAMQGAGAIAPAIMALAADLSAPEKRSRIMAMIGGGVGLAFGSAFIVSPILYASLGLGMLFWICAGLAVLAILALLFLVPDPPAVKGAQKQNPLSASAPTMLPRFRSLLDNPKLLDCCLGIFVSHLILMATFTILPVLLYSRLEIPIAQHWQFYIPILLASLAISVAMILSARRKETQNLPLCMGLFVIAQLCLFFSETLTWMIYAGMLLFFIGFNYLEATLPAVASNSVEENQRGAALGLYNTLQFIGIFCGGALGGAMQALAGPQAIFLACTGLPLAWFFLTRRKLF